MTRSDRPVLLASVFTDYICPFCYIADRRLERLRSDYDLRINWCFLEIHPETPAAGMSTGRLGYSASRWKTMQDNLGLLAREEGIRFLPHDFTTNSHRALLLAEAAKEAGAEAFYRLHRALFVAFFTEGRNIGDSEVLRQIAQDSGIPAELVARAWTDAGYPRRLKQYLNVARELGVRATPTVYFGEQRRIDGVQPFSVFRDAARAGVREQQSGAS
ncbi:MAG: DsbA family protein [Gammaproteobacteria bacterium]